MKSSSIPRYFLAACTSAAFVIVLVQGASAAGSLAHQQLHSQPSSGITIEASEQLFATMCALDAAGFDSGVSTLAEMPARLKLREDLLKLEGPATEALRKFYQDHQLADPSETLSRFISFALVVGPPPRFPFLLSHDLLPPDVLAIDGFQELLVNFYREAGLDRRWAAVQGEYTRAISVYQSPVRQVVFLANGYLREVSKPSSPRTFAVYVESLVGSHTNFRNTGDHYAIVVGSRQPPLDEIRHAYLHFVLDPLPLRYRAMLEKESALLNMAARAPRLPAEYQTDFVAFFDECLVQAVELRLRHVAGASLEAALRNADESGFVLVRPLVRELQKFEKSAPAMTYYFPDLVAGINVAAEQDRLRKIEFASAQPARPPQDHAPTSGPSELEEWLAEGDRELAMQDAAAATGTFEKILAKYPNQPRATYGLAIAFVLTRNADRARQLFEELVAVPAAGAGQSAGAADPTILSWSHVYLGRMHDLGGERELAVSEYRAALSVEGAPEAARVAAQRGIDQAYRPPPHGGNGEPGRP